MWKLRQTGIDLAGCHIGADPASEWGRDSSGPPSTLRLGSSGSTSGRRGKGLSHRRLQTAAAAGRGRRRRLREVMRGRQEGA